MANIFKSPWKIDTVGSVSPLDSSRGTAEYPRIYFSGMTFMGYTDASHKAVFKADGASGPVVIELFGAPDLSPVSLLRVNERAYTGLYLAQLDSGAVVIDVI